MGRLWIVLFALLLLVPSRRAEACINATMGDDEAIATLKQAEEALAIGDTKNAHALARKVMFETEEEKLHARSVRLDTLATIRDPNETPNEIKNALAELEKITPATASPAELADLGEAYAANRDDAKAYAVLAPLAAKDLIGSAYANAALSRVATRRGETALAKTTRDRCLLAATTPAICDGAYPRPARLWSMLEGTVAGYLAPAFVLLGALGLGRVLARRKKHSLGDVFTAAQATERRSFRSYVVAALIVGFGALAFLSAEYMFLSTTLAAAAGAIAILRLLDVGTFIRAVASGRVEAFAVRPATAEDAQLPSVKLFFVREPRTIERLEEPAYREGARTPLLRVVPRPAELLLALVATLLSLTFLLGAVLATRASASLPSEEIPKNQAP